MLATLFFATCLVAAILPGLGAEAAMLGSAVLTDGVRPDVLIVLAATAHSLGKLFVYAMAAAGERYDIGSGRGVRSLRAALERSRNTAAMIVVASAFTSVPPLYATTIVCGVARLGATRFGVATFVGRLLRYGVLVAFLDPVRTMLP